MRSMTLDSESPYSLILAADARVTGTDYLDDQIWEIRLDDQELPALAAWTTYGRRAPGMAIFPTFAVDALSTSNLQDPGASAKLELALPNFIRLSFRLATDLEGLAEYWVADSHRLVGRITLHNVSKTGLNLRLQLHAQLQPGDEIVPMGGRSHEGVNVLEGQVGRTAPVVFLSGGAILRRATVPTLEVSSGLQPGERRSWTWSHAGLGGFEASFQSARETASISLDAASARLEHLADTMIDIQTGDPGWDAVLHFSQVAALASFVGPTRHLPAASPILVRSPDYGFSMRGDGTDYEEAWDGQDALQAYFVARQVLPSAPQLAIGVVRNALTTQAANGTIDGKPGLAGQRRRVGALPVYADLAWHIYRQEQDGAFLREVFPALHDSFESWFRPACDADGDGYPEWTDSRQADSQDCPTFSAGGEAVDISLVESPDLSAWLLCEADALENMARLLGRTEVQDSIRERRAGLLAGLERDREADGAFRRVDRDTHQETQPHEIDSARGAFKRSGPGALDGPVRLVLHLAGPEAEGRGIEVVLSGRGLGGARQTIRLSGHDFQWTQDGGTAMPGALFTHLERWQVRGAPKTFRSSIAVADLTGWDLSRLLPLRAGCLDPGEARTWVRQWLLADEHFWRNFGFPRLPASAPRSQDLAHGAGAMSMPWNMLMVEGLLSYGMYAEAGRAVERLMRAADRALRQDHAFCQSYNADTGQGLGVRHFAGGIFPHTIFLNTLGVELMSPTRVGLRGRHPFPWPVSVSWRGLTVMREGELDRVIFPDGQTLEFQGDEPKVIEQHRTMEDSKLGA
jgi:hypothetical protein